MVRARVLEELVDIWVAQLPVSAHVRKMVAAELVGEGNVCHHMPVDVVDDKIAATGLTVGLVHRGYAVALCGQAQVVTDLLQRTQDHLVGILRAATVLLAGVVRVDNVPMARADEGRPHLVDSLA